MCIRLNCCDICAHGTSEKENGIIVPISEYFIIRYPIPFGISVIIIIVIIINIIDVVLFIPFKKLD